MELVRIVFSDLTTSGTNGTCGSGSGDAFSIGAPARRTSVFHVNDGGTTASGSGSGSGSVGSGASGAGGAGGRGGVGVASATVMSVGSQFRVQLNELMEKVHSSLCLCLCLSVCLSLSDRSS